MTKKDKLLEAIKEKADGILITSEVNQLYLTGFEFSDGYVLITKEKSYLLTDFRYTEAAKKCVKSEFEILNYSADTFEALFKENSVKRLLFEDGRMTVSSLESFKAKYPFIEFIPAGDVIEGLREYKEATEVEHIITAQRIAEKALRELLEHPIADMTEKDVAALLEYFLKRNGADGISFSTIAVSGSASSLPHGVPRDVKVEKGFLTLDFGAVYKGYHSDMTRTLCIGKADEEMKKVYNTVLEAQTKAIEAIFEGKRSCFEIDGIARDFIYSKGYEGCFGHGLGHGVGLEIHEAPRLSPKTDKAKLLQRGDVITVEPGIYLEGKYGVRIEDMIYLGDNGPLNLTNFEKNLIEL